MKKLIVTGLVCALAITAAGCGESAEGNNSGLVVEKIGEDAAGSDNNAGEQSGEKTEEGAAGNKEAQSESKEKAADANAESAENTDGAAEGNLYEAFQKGTAKAKYRGTGDMAAYFDTASAFEAGQSYTMDEILKALEGADGTVKFLSDVKYSNIDCGQDGVPELLVEASSDGEVSFLMIIKEIDGELVICYDQDSWSRSSVTVNSNGTIEGSGSGGAAVHVVDYAFVDGKGDYNYYYGCEETLTLSEELYAYMEGEDYAVIPMAGVDVDHYGVRDYYFEADYTKRTHYYEYFRIDDSYNDVTTEADYDDSNELKQRFDDAGIKTYTKADIDKMLKDRAAKIAYPGAK